MLLADLGAEVIRIEREGGNGYPNPIVDRGRTTKTLDIRSDEGRDWCLGAIKAADVLIEGMRPGVMERLGLGPDPCHALNPGLVYGRVTGWGQHGPMAQMAGHDINYIGMTGALAAMGREGEPAAIPLNLVGDFGGGSMFLITGILAALYERSATGHGRVVDAAIVDGTASLMSFFYGLAQTGQVSLKREDNLLGGSAPFYRTYLCADGKEVAVGALEPKFFGELVAKLELPEWASRQYDRSCWSELADVFARTFATRDRDHWAELFAGSDACVTPVLACHEVGQNEHMASRGIVANEQGVCDLPKVPAYSGSGNAAIAERKAMSADQLLALWEGR
jgi:alpha-methylacyl-CoA racemase